MQISLKFVPKNQIDNKSALIQVMTWRQTGAKPLPGTLMTHLNDAYMSHLASAIEPLCIWIKLFYEVTILTNNMLIKVLHVNEVILKGNCRSKKPPFVGFLSTG